VTATSSAVGNMALFKVRVTGAGYGYLPKLDEYVYMAA
jgi:hypothetical protein